MKHCFLACPLILGTLVSALRLDVQGQRRVDEPHLRRGLVEGNLSLLDNESDLSYHTNITLGGTPFRVLVDTGSSDLWVAGRVPNSKITGNRAGIRYVLGAVEGPVKTAALEFSGYTVPDQAFIEVIPDIENPSGQGVLGLGPNSGSNVAAEINTIAGAAVMDRIFLQNRTLPNYLTVLMGREVDPTDHFGGSLTVGEVLDGYGDVLNEPRLPMTDVPGPFAGNQHFQVLLDVDGIIGPDGESIPLRTDVLQTVNKRQATAVMDTGFSLPQLPRTAAAAIYSRFDGAEFANVPRVGQVWLIPCDQEVNITFKFAGRRYPIHPLDATFHPSALGLATVRNSEGKSTCIGTFQPFSYDRGANIHYDMVLGMAFLRNVYMLVDYGDFVAGSTKRDDPYMQMLSTTDPAEAHLDFVQVRLNGTDTTMDKGLVGGQGSSKTSHTAYYIIAGVAVATVLLCVGGFFVWRARRDRRQREAAEASTTASHVSPHCLAPPIMQPVAALPHYGQATYILPKYSPQQHSYPSYKSSQQHGQQSYTNQTPYNPDPRLNPTSQYQG